MIPPTEIVPAALQREVLGLMMDALKPEALAIPEKLLAMLGSTDGSDPEEFKSSAGHAFDQLSRGPHACGHGHSNRFSRPSARRA